MSKRAVVKYSIDSKEYTRELNKLEKLIKRTQKQLDKLNKTPIGIVIK